MNATYKNNSHPQPKLGEVAQIEAIKIGEKKLNKQPFSYFPPGQDRIDRSLIRVSNAIIPSCFGGFKNPAKVVNCMNFLIIESKNLSNKRKEEICTQLNNIKNERVIATPKGCLESIRSDSSREEILDVIDKAQKYIGKNIKQHTKKEYTWTKLNSNVRTFEAGEAPNTGFGIQGKDEQIVPLIQEYKIGEGATGEVNKATAKVGEDKEKEFALKSANSGCEEAIADELKVFEKLLDEVKKNPEAFEHLLLDYRVKHPGRIGFWVGEQKIAKPIIITLLKKLMTNKEVTWGALVGVLKGLNTLHELGLSHQDVKYDNCFESRGKKSRFGYLGDFGTVQESKLVELGRSCGGRYPAYAAILAVTQKGIFSDNHQRSLAQDKMAYGMMLLNKLECANPKNVGSLGGYVESDEWKNICQGLNKISKFTQSIVEWEKQSVDDFDAKKSGALSNSHITSVIKCQYEEITSNLAKFVERCNADKQQYAIAILARDLFTDPGLKLNEAIEQFSTVADELDLSKKSNEKSPL